VDGGYRIEGAKTFCSGAARGRVPGGRPQRRRPVEGVAVPGAGRRGLRVEETWDALGMRATGSHDLHVDVTVPAGALLGGVEGWPWWSPSWRRTGWWPATRRSTWAWPGPRWTPRSSTSTSASWATCRPIRARIGRADAAVAARHLAVMEAARRVDEAPGDAETNRWVWRAKLLAGTTAAEVAASMLEAAGTSAMRRGHPLERLYRDARAGSLQPATSDVCADWLGVDALGGDPDSEGSPRDGEPSAVGRHVIDRDHRGRGAAALAVQDDSGRATSPAAHRRPRGWPSGSSRTPACAPGRRR
jgi:hypothetical protein